MFSSKLFILLACSLAITLASPVKDVQMDGEPHQYTGDELKTAFKPLQDTLDKLASGFGVHYEVSKINSASSQVVSGILTKLNADLINSGGEVSNCNISIWSQPWLPNGIEVKVDCEGQKPLVGRLDAGLKNQ